MLRTIALLAMSVLLPSLTSAQSSSQSDAASVTSSSASSSSSTSGPKTYRVNVGAFGSHVFDPVSFSVKRLYWLAYILVFLGICLRNLPTMGAFDQARKTELLNHADRTVFLISTHLISE